MKPVKILIGFYLLAALLLLTAAPAHAEWYVDIWLGGAQTDDGRITIESSDASEDVDQEFGSSLALGFRLGAWLDQTPWLGLAMDFSMFDVDFPAEEVYINAWSLLVTVRAPLIRSGDFPYGRLQPYLGLGPCFFSSSYNYYYSAAPWMSVNTTDQDNTTFDIGLDLRAGLAVMISPQIAIIGEFRYTAYDLEFEGDIPGGYDKAGARLETRYWLIGIRFNR